MAFSFLHATLHADRPFGKMIRLPLRLLPPGMKLPFFQSSLWGKYWIAGSGPYSYWLGIAERRKKRQIEGRIKSGDVVCDIGANVGYYTLIASSLVGSQGRIHAFEPSPRNMALLRQHMAINQVDNVNCWQMAVADTEGTARFATDLDPVMQRMSEDGDALVPVTTLDAFVKQQRMSRMDVIKIDVEGAELKVLQGARETLTRFKPVLFVETHDFFVPGVHKACEGYLRALGYQVSVLAPNEIQAQ